MLTKAPSARRGLAASIACYLVGVPLLTHFVAPGGMAAVLLAIPLYTISWSCGRRWGLLGAALGIAYNSVNWVFLGDGRGALRPDGVPYLVVLYIVECAGAALLVLLVAGMKGREAAGRRELERSKELLRQSEAKYRTLIDLAPAAVFVVQDGTLIFCNRQAADMAGISPAALVGQPIRALLHEEDVTVATQMFASRAAGETTPPSVVRLRTRRGAVIWVETVGQRIDWGGRPAVMYFSTDVTERRNAEEALRESERRYRVSETKYRNLVDGAPEGVWVVENARVSFCNAHFAQTLGYTLEEMVGMSVETFNHPEDRERSMARYAARAAGKRLPKSLTRHVRKDGSLLWVETVGHLIDWEGRPAVLYFSSDVTERRVFEEQLVQAQKMEAIGRLAGGIAHDFNNLLQVILGFCAMLRGYPEDRRALLNDLAVIEDSARKAAALTQQLLTFSRKQVTQPRALDARTLVRQSERMLSRVLGDNVQLIVHTGEEEAAVRADAGQLEQIVLNLAINARDAMPAGGRITIRVQVVSVPLAAGADLPPGRYVQLEVEDTGRGMDAQTLGHIFEPFFTTRAGAGGTGLGLSIVYGIVQQNGGRIRAHSVPGKGSTFTILLPRVSDVEAAAAAPAPEEEYVGSGSVLVVEDQEPVRRFVRIVLERAGFTVTEAQSGEEAVQACRDACFDLLITDVVLTGISGDAVAETVRGIRPGIRVIYMSGYLTEQSSARIRGTRLLHKPFSPSDLLAQVKHAFSP